jgi:hypothetical protein
VSLAVAVALAVLAAALLELLKDELRGQIERIPFGLLRLARRLVPDHLRETLYDLEWLPELHHILAESERLPITCLVRGTRYALGLVVAARTIAVELGPVRGPVPAGAPDREVAMRVKLVVGAVAAAASLLSGFGVFGAFGGVLVSLVGGLVVVGIVYALTRDLSEGWRERTPWA